MTADGAGMETVETAEATAAEAGAGVCSDDPAVPLELVDVSKEYDSAGGVVEALKGVDFAVRAGEFVAVIGPSGSGKSTLLNVLGLLDVPTAGTVCLDGRDVTTLDDEALTRARKESIGFVFQDFYLIPTLTATENVELPTLFDDGPTASGRAADLLGRVGLADRLDHRPDQLSGGQKQRVAIARSLINEPAVVLADEPTGNLDQDTGRSVLGEFRRVCDAGVGLVAVTHDPLVTEFADRTVELTDGVLTREDAGPESQELAGGEG
jgi:putative ABC transport system ATP-binding protein